MVRESGNLLRGNQIFYTVDMVYTQKSVSYPFPPCSINLPTFGPPNTRFHFTIIK